MRSALSDLVLITVRSYGEACSTMLTLILYDVLLTVKASPRECEIRTVYLRHIVGEPKPRIVHKHIFAPEKYTAGIVYTLIV